MITVNPLNILKKRELSTMPPHFAKTKCAVEGLFDIEKDMRNWILTKLHGRFSIVKLPAIGQDSKIKSIKYVGFEDHKELTYFMLACPYIRR